MVSRFKFIRRRKLKNLILKAFCIEVAISFLNDGIQDFHKFMIKSWDDTNLLHEDYYVKRAENSLDATQYILELGGLSSRMDKLEEMQEKNMREIEEYYDNAIAKLELRVYQKFKIRRKMI